MSPSLKVLTTYKPKGMACKSFLNNGVWVTHTGFYKLKLILNN